MEFTNEKDFQKAALELCRKHPFVGLVWRTDSDFQRARMTRSRDRIGLPDLGVVLKTGEVCFIELKDPNTGGNKRMAQKEFIAKAKSFGVRAGFARSLEQVLDIIEGK